MESLTLNGQAIAVDYNGFNIQIPASALAKGRHTVEVVYNHPYRRDDRGLSWFLDAEDGESYVATQFEPDDFNKVFPGFDQPDIKGTYQLNVDVPGHWTVVSAKPESSITRLENDRALWTFPRTRRFSTYLISLHAGPFHIWEDADFRVPLRIYARQSYAKHVAAEEWLEITRNGFDFFEAYFGVPYPFDRYDQLAIPEKKWGAMENVGAVTYNEWLHPRRDKTYEDMKNLSVTTMHEMAHQWFGNLVTMHWWDDLWLNESFADMMGYVATSKATKYVDATEMFSIRRKSWGYGEDQWITTHPITQPIPDSRSISAFFDGITYSKGAAVLFQLRHLLGDEQFSNGLQHYFKKHRWGNTTAEDFIRSLEEAADRDLAVWSEQWFRRAGVNSLETELVCVNEKITTLTLIQHPANASGVVREHKMDLKLIGPGDQIKVFDIHPNAARNAVTEVIGEPCPDLVFPNPSDHGYATWLIDQTSFDYLRDNFNKFDDPVEKGIIWRSLWETVIDGTLPTTDFLDFGLKYLPMESDINVVGGQLRNLGYAYSLLVNYDAIHNLDPGFAQRYREKLATLSYAQYNATEDSMKRAWFNTWTRYLGSPQSRDAALTLLESEISMDDKWRLANALARIDHPDAETRLQALHQEDNSNTAKNSLIAAEASRPDPEIKRKWLAEIANPDSEYSAREIGRALGNLFPPDQYELQLSLEKLIHDTLPVVVKNKPDWLAGNFAINLLPVHCTPERAETFMQLAADYGHIDQLEKMLLMKSHIERRCANQIKNMPQYVAAQDKL